MTQHLFDVRFDSHLLRIDMNGTCANCDGLVPLSADWQSHLRSVARDYCLIKSNPLWKPCADHVRARLQSTLHARWDGVPRIDSRFTSKLRCTFNMRTTLSSSGKWLRCVKWRIDGMKQRRKNQMQCKAKIKQRALPRQNGAVVVVVVVAVDSTKCSTIREKCNDLWLRNTLCCRSPFSPTLGYANEEKGEDKQINK